MVDALYLSVLLGLFATTYALVRLLERLDDMS